MLYLPYYTLVINIVVGQLTSSNLNIPRSLLVRQSSTRGLSAHTNHKCIPGANNLTPDSSNTRHMVLRSNPSPLTPGPNSNTGTIKQQTQRPH